MVGIYSSSILAEEGVTVYGNVEDKEQRSVDFTSVIYNNFEKTSHEIYHIKPLKD
jgi:starvation-inducible outer membrane lipoprotein